MNAQLPLVERLVHEEIATRRKVWKAAGVKAE